MKFEVLIKWNVTKWCWKSREIDLSCINKFFVQWKKMYTFVKKWCWKSGEINLSCINKSFVQWTKIKKKYKYILSISICISIWFIIYSQRGLCKGILDQQRLIVTGDGKIRRRRPFLFVFRAQTSTFSCDICTVRFHFKKNWNSKYWWNETWRNDGENREKLICLVLINPLSSSHEK